MVSEFNLHKFKEELIQCSRPLFLFDDDPDGLCSFLLLYRFVKKGNGRAIKGSTINNNMIDFVNSYQPDLLVVLDKADIEEEFLEGIDCKKVIWIDHHKPVKKKVTLYLNPMIDSDDNSATSYWAYKVVEQDLWISAVGMVSDWQLPDKKMIASLKKNYPDFLKGKTPEKALFEDDVGKLAKIFSFNLKGKTSDVVASMKILSRVENPYDILEGKNAQTRLLLKMFEKNNKEYDRLINSVVVDDEDLVVFMYISSENAFTTDLSNELLYKNPEKLILVARESNGSYKCSLRSAKYNILEILEKVLSSINGSGGGHKYACGAVIDSSRFDDFISLIKENMK
jgi:single-stranded DNA-specific DHH superfamily exonuclease